MSAVNSWTDANQRYLLAALARVRAALERHVTPTAGNGNVPATVPVFTDLPGPPALETVCDTFGLSDFERDVLLLCAGMELESDFAMLCAQVQDDPQRPFPTFSLALAALPDAHWSALTPAAPLRHWRLVEIGSGRTLTTSPLRLDERILHYLTGVQHLDEHLQGFVYPLSATATLVPSQQGVAEQIAAVWSQSTGAAPLPVIQLCGLQTAAKQAIAAAACALLDLNLFVMPAHVLPGGPHELDSLIHLWQREAALSASALLLDCEGLEHTDKNRESLLTHFVERVGGALLLSGHERRRGQIRPFLTFDISKPTPAEQRQLWRTALGPVAASANGQLDQLVSQFDLNAPTIVAATTGALGQIAALNSPTSASDIGHYLWDACRLQARPQLDDLARRIKPVATWDDIVIPEQQRQTLRDIAVHVRQRARVYETWGFAARSNRGLGISALFAGGSGTGKTMAAEVLANELNLDLYLIDLSQVVSKYIGETEKNLRRVFDAAEEGGAILLFDEADALFGKRSEVKDSHDRYANIEVSYLLQRMEAYRGLAILTTNMKNALDNAFLRRIRFTVQFPFPDERQRASIWQRIFPADTPTAALDNQKLARLNIAGGNIRNIALNAAFYAADAGEPVSMAHILRAARREYAKLEKALTDFETRGWMTE